MFVCTNFGPSWDQYDKQTTTKKMRFLREINFPHEKQQPCKKNGYIIRKKPIKSEKVNPLRVII